MDRPRALVIGGSVGGLFAAHLLRASGWDATVFERSRDDLAGRGASIGTRADLFRVMERIGIHLDPSAGVPVDARIYLEPDGRIGNAKSVVSINSAWDRIYRPLRDAFPSAEYRAGMRLERCEQTGDGVTAVFADGTCASGDLLIGADGIKSTVRTQFLPELQPVYAGYVAWRGVIEESALTADEHALLFGRMCFCLPENELVLALGMPGRDDDTRAGHRRYYWIWFRPADATHILPVLCTDATGRCHGNSIPPSLVRPEVVRELRARAAATLAPPVAAIVARTAQPFPHGIFDLEVPRMVWGRVVLLGDSAFVARPHVGAGITKAALDAQCLADALAGGDISSALAAYDRERRAFGTALIARGRYLGTFLNARQPETVLTEYGAAGKVGG
jgi:2-polyprenyl-6-methoxyphenol hydroxylase-like FAD-dependent oxidoreductase